MTPEQVLHTQREVFYRALVEQDWDALARLYTDDYTLVRSDGSVLTKTEVLDDLRSDNLKFDSIELRDEKVLIIDSVAILTGESRTRSKYKGVEVQSRFRLIALYVETAEGPRLLHFQSTSIVH
jgi:ketosteroid isomerase-like protein